MATVAQHAAEEGTPAYQARKALEVMLDTAMACDDLAWAHAIARAGVDVAPCDAALRALARLNGSSWNAEHKASQVRRGWPHTFSQGRT